MEGPSASTDKRVCVCTLRWWINTGVNLPPGNEFIMWRTGVDFARSECVGVASHLA